MKMNSPVLLFALCIAMSSFHCCMSKPFGKFTRLLLFVFGDRIYKFKSNSTGSARRCLAPERRPLFPLYAGPYLTGEQQRQLPPSQQN